MERQEFKDIPYAWKRVMKDRERLEYLEQKSDGVGGMQTTERVQSSNLNRSMAIADTIIDLQSRIDVEEKELRARMDEAVDMIKSNGLNERDKEIMLYRYKYCLDWLDISEIMQMTTRWVLKRHGIALSKIFD